MTNSNLETMRHKGWIVNGTKLALLISSSSVKGDKSARIHWIPKSSFSVKTVVDPGGVGKWPEIHFALINYAERRIGQDYSSNI